MIFNPRQFFDQQRDAWQRPEGGLVALSDRACEQGFDDLLRLFDGQFWFGASRPLAGQSRPPALSPSILPPVSHLSGDSQTARHVRRRAILGEQFARLKAALFQLGMIPGLRHAITLHYTQINVTLICESQ